MRRGTTPTITLTIDNNYNLSMATDVWVTFEQGGTEFTKKWARYPDESDPTANQGITVSGQTVVITLSQEETLQFEKGSVTVQAKMKKNDFDDGTIYDEVVGTETKKIKVEDILDEEVM